MCARNYPRNKHDSHQLIWPEELAQLGKEDKDRFLTVRRVYLLLTVETVWSIVCV